MRVFVTAVGIVSPLAVGAEPTFQALCSGRRALRPITLFDVGASRSRVVAEVPPIDISAIESQSRFPLARVDVMAILAAREAIEKASLSKNAIVDLVTSGVQGGMFETETTLVAMHRRNRPRVPEKSLVMHPVSATADRLRELVFPFRRARTISSACSGGASAIAVAETWIRSGRSSSVLAGGADALCRFTFAGFALLSSLDPNPCRPFDASRAGLNLGEGAAYLLLQSEDEVLRRGLVPLAELSSAAMGSEGKHIIQPEESGETLARVVRESLVRGGLSRHDIGYINAHGTGTTLNDIMETAAYRAVFAADVDRIAVSSCKGQLGHALGAAAAIEAAVTVLALSHGEIPPTGGLVKPDPKCDLLHVMDQSRKYEFRAALSSSAGFGGGITVLAFAKPYAFASPVQNPAARIVVTAATSLGPLGLCDAPSADYLNAGAPPVAGPAAIADDALDPNKSRRFDGAAYRLALVAKKAFDATILNGNPLDTRRTAIVVGLALRGGDVGAAFLAPALESDFRTGKPIVFPGLLPSSPTAYASIYLSLNGPALTTIDREASTCAALSIAADLVAANHADAIMVGGLSEWDELTWEAVGPACFHSSQWPEPLTDGAAAIVIERADSAAKRGAQVLATLVAYQSDCGPRLCGIPAPTNPVRALVVADRDDLRLSEVVSGTEWANVCRVGIAARAGAHEALGAIAMAAAVQAIAMKRADEVLVVSVTEGRLEANLFAFQLGDDSLMIENTAPQGSDTTAMRP